MMKVAIWVARNDLGQTLAKGRVMSPVESKQLVSLFLSTNGFGADQMQYWQESSKRRILRWTEELKRASKVETCTTHQLKKKKKKIGSAICAKKVSANGAQELQKALR